jgi:HSP20 family protein
MVNFLRPRKNEDTFLTDAGFPAFFEDFFDVPVLFGRAFGNNLAVDVYEEKDNIVAKVELPGAKPEEVKISIEGDLLKITGEKKQEKEIKREDYYQSQVRYGKFQRFIQLPAEVKTDQAKATYKNGILKITMPKAQEKQSKDVRINIE